MYVEKESFDVAAILTDVLDSGRRELPFVDLFVLLRGDVPDPDGLQQGKAGFIHIAMAGEKDRVHTIAMAGNKLFFPGRRKQFLRIFPRTFT